MMHTLVVAALHQLRFTIFGPSLHCEVLLQLLSA
jgi:hypothetical protein